MNSRNLRFKTIASLYDFYDNRECNNLDILICELKDIKVIYRACTHFINVLTYIKIHLPIITISLRLIYINYFYNH